MEIKVFNKENAPSMDRTSLQGYINITYNDLIKILGKPTYNEPSGDDKTQVEWVIEFEDNLFSIYDWKTYDVEFTKNKLTQFNIGGKTNPLELEEYIQQSLTSIL